MLKIVRTILPMALLAITLSACNSNVAIPSSAQVQSNSVASSSSASSPSISESVPAVSSQAEQTKFEQFEAGLDKLNLKYKKVTMGAELVGAEQGTKYKLSDGNVELYKFDKSSAAYKKALKNKTLTLEGFGDFPAKFNDNMALMFDDDVKEKASIEGLFNSIK